MENWTEEEILEYQSLFEISQKLIGKNLNSITFYLDDEQKNYSEQENIYGKSLFNSVELKIDNESYVFGNLFFKKDYNGLNILKGKVSDYENIEDKKPINFPSNIVGQKIISVKIYWGRAFWGKYFVPHEIVICTTDSYLLFSAIEVNFGEVNTEITNELLLIEDENISKELLLGKYGIEKNGRFKFQTLKELIENEKNIG